MIQKFRKKVPVGVDRGVSREAMVRGTVAEMLDTMTLEAIETLFNFKRIAPSQEAFDEAVIKDDDYLARTIQELDFERRVLYKLSVDIKGYFPETRNHDLP